MDDVISNCDARESDRRQAERKRAFTAGLLVYGGGAFVLDCLIRDIGAGGAQIRTSKTQPIPNEAYLINLKSWFGYQVCRVWHRSSLAGFSFEQEYPLNGMLPVNLEFLRNLFIEAQLRQVDRLTGQGAYMSEVLAKVGVTNATYFRWLDSSPKLSPRRLRTK
jgi:hypothetical protein